MSTGGRGEWQETLSREEGNYLAAAQRKVADRKGGRGPRGPGAEQEAAAPVWRRSGGSAPERAGPGAPAGCPGPVLPPRGASARAAEGFPEEGFLEKCVLGRPLLERVPQSP